MPHLVKSIERSKQYFRSPRKGKDLVKNGLPQLESSVGCDGTSSSTPGRGKYPHSLVCFSFIVFGWLGHSLVCLSFSCLADILMTEAVLDLEVGLSFFRLLL